MARSIFFYTDSRVLGGAENAMFALLESLDPAAWRPTLLLEDAAGTEALEARAAALDVEVWRVPPLPLGLTGARRVPALARRLRAAGPDVFHAHMSSPVACKFGLAAAVLARVPAVVGTVQVGEYEPPDRSAYWQLRALAHGVDRYLAVSRAIADELVGRLDWPASRIEVVYNSVDVGRFQVEAPPGLRAELGAEGRPLILTPARLDAQKGHPFLLEALREVPDAVLALAGEGPERAALEGLAQRLGVKGRVRFLGRREDVPELLAACDVFALPSLYEGSSLAVLEAMAAGRAVVSSAIGGTDELIEDGRSGLLVEPGDAVGLAAALRRLIEDPALREELAGRARERVERDLTRRRMAARVTGVYEELLGGAPAGVERDVEAMPEARRNRQLRQADWRFALPGAELVDRRRLPRPGGVEAIRRRAAARGLDQVVVLWPGPVPGRAPQFWLPLGVPAATEHLLAARPARSTLGRLLRLGWRLAARFGFLAPLYAVGTRGASAIEPPLPARATLLLLTGGHRSINKVVGLAFEPGAATPSAAVKFARVPAAEEGLRREAEVLRRLGQDRPDLAGFPRLLGEGRRDGRVAVVEEAVSGVPALEGFTAAAFADLAPRVVRLLAGLARPGEVPGPAWRERLVEGPLARFEVEFGPVLGGAGVAAVATELASLESPPPAIEHRDCSPWNVLVAPGREPVLVDWESAEPDGLAGVDLVYFLANCAFVLDGAIESGRTRESYARLLDPATPSGRIAAAAFDDYRAAAGISGADMRRLRILCWLVHSHSDHRHLMLDGRPPTPAQLRDAMFLGLLEEELGR